MARRVEDNRLVRYSFGLVCSLANIGTGNWHKTNHIVYIYICLLYRNHIASIWGEAPLSKDAQMAPDMFIYLYTMKLGLV